MFTGLVEKVGTLVKTEKRYEGMVLTISHDDPWPDDIVLGESIAVQGACLTVVDYQQGIMCCDVLQETLNKTNLGKKEKGSPLNLERAMQAGSRFGGHIVTGHVDGVGEIVTKRDTGRDWILEIKCSQPLIDGIVEKGSITCDGISLTISNLSSSSFEVSIIPYTWEHTSLKNLNTGSSINIETDILGKYVSKYMNKQKKPESSIDIKMLNDAGF